MKTKIVLNELIVESDFSGEEILNLTRYNESAGRLIDGTTGEVIFVVGYSEHPLVTGGLCENGVIYALQTPNGKAAVKVAVEGTTDEERVLYASEKYWNILDKLSKLERQMSEEIRKMNDTKADIADMIEVLA